MALKVPLRETFSVTDVKNGARIAVGAVVAGFAFAELWDNDIQKLNVPVVDDVTGATSYAPELKNASNPGYIDEGAPASIALMLLAIASVSMVAFAVIMLMERTPSSEAPAWKTSAAGAQVYVSVLALITSAFYAGFKTTEAQSIGDALSERPGGLFLGLALLKIVEFVTCIVLLLNPSDPLYEAVGMKLGDKGMSQRLDDRMQATKHSWVSLGFAFAITLIAAVNVDCDPVKDANTGLYTGECTLKGLSATGNFVWVAFVSLTVVLALLFLVSGFLLRMFDLGDASGRFRYHAGVDHLSAVGAYTALSAIAMEVGRGFFQQYYTQLFVGANFWYFSGLLFGFFGAVHLEGEGMIGEKRSLTQVQRSQGALVLMAIFLGVFSTAALWGTDILFNKLEGDATQTKQKLELDVYAVITVLVLSSHVVLTKVVEAFVMPELQICGIFTATGPANDEVEVTTKRSEATLALALASAVYFGHADWELSLTLLFIGALGARAIGFWHRFRESAEDQEQDYATALGAFIYDDKARKLELGDEGVLYGGLSLVASHILASVYIFRDGEPVPAESDTLRYWEFTAWLLLTVHVGLTLLGLFTKYHAGFLPLVRFGASSIIIVVLSASLGEHALKDHLYPYIAPALLTYIMYDALSQARF